MRDGDVTEAGHPERRRFERRRKSRRADERGHEPLTRGDFARWVNRRALPAFVVLTLVSTAAGFLGYSAGQDSQRGLKRQGIEATKGNCISGGEMRIAVANGFDDLRWQAVRPGTSSRVVIPFIARTQPAIDTLLTQAAGREYHAPLPPGRVTSSVVFEVRRLSALRCQLRADRVFQTPPG